MKTAKTVFGALALVALTACTYSPDPGGPPAIDPAPAKDMILASYAAADQLVQMPQGALDRGKPILVASLVNINNLEKSSALGRMIAEQMAARLVTTGYTLVELKMRTSFLIKEGKGEFVLSRNVRNISHSHGAQAVIAGTYAIGNTAVYVNVRLVRAADSKILAAYDYSLPLDANILSLVGGAQYREVS